MGTDVYSAWGRYVCTLVQYLEIYGALQGMMGRKGLQDLKEIQGNEGVLRREIV